MKIRFNNIVATVLAESEKENSAYQDLRRKMKVFAPGAVYTPAYKKYRQTKGKHGWNGKTNILHEKGTFLTGLLPVIVSRLWNEYKILPTLIDNRIKIEKLHGFINVKLRDYQIETLQKCLNNKWNNLFWPRGILNLPVGSGKTQTAIALYESNPYRTLFIVDKKSLAYQTVERFEQYGHYCGKLFDKHFEIKENILVATIQSLSSKKHDIELSDYLKNVKQVITDESHHVASSLAKGNIYVDILSKLENAFFRYGLTATAFLKDQYSNWLLAGTTGNILHSIPSSKLIEEEYLVPPKIEIIQVPKVSKCPNNWHEAYEIGIILNESRTKLLIDKLEKIPKPALVLVSSIAHMEIILTRCRSRGIKACKLQGSDDSQKRKEVLENFIKSKSVLVTTLFDEGIDIPELRTVILAAGGKSPLKTIQRVGRGLRKSPGKKEVLIVDFFDTSCSILKKHSKERIKTYVNQEFKIPNEVLRLLQKN